MASFNDLPADVLPMLAKLLAPPTNARADYGALLAFAQLSRRCTVHARREMLRTVTMRSAERLNAFSRYVTEDEGATVEELILVLPEGESVKARMYMAAVFRLCSAIRTLRLINFGPLELSAGALAVLTGRTLRELHLKDTIAVGRRWKTEHLAVLGVPDRIETLRLTDIRMGRHAHLPPINLAGELIAVNGNWALPQQPHFTVWASLQQPLPFALEPPKSLSIVETIETGPVVGLADTVGLALLPSMIANLETLSYSGPRIGAVRDCLRRGIVMRSLTFYNACHHSVDISWEYVLSNLPPNLVTLTIESMDAPTGPGLLRAIEDSRWPASITSIHLHESKAVAELGAEEVGGTDLEDVVRGWMETAEACEARGIHLCGVDYLAPDDDDDDDGDDSDDDADDKFAVNSLAEESDDGASNAES